MPTFRVDLVANLEMTYTIEVEAADQAEAENKAVLNAPTEASVWEGFADYVNKPTVQQCTEVEEEGRNSDPKEDQ